MALGYRVKVSSKGQIVIPKKLRESMGWEQGDEIEFEVIGERRFLMRKVLPEAEEPRGKAWRKRGTA
jgi:AbrB family looped-hinge helix DNA binding protein